MRRRLGGALIVVAALAGCSSTRTSTAPSQATAPPAATTSPATSAPTTSPSADAGATTIQSSVAERAAPTTARNSTTSEAPTTTRPPPPTEQDWSLFDVALAGRLLANGGDYTASVAITVDGDVVHHAAYGARVPVVPPLGGAAPPPVALDAIEPVEPTDRFRIASISKVITAIVVLTLVEDGELELDERVGNRLAAHVGATITDPAMSTITVRQLLSHTTGLDPYERTFFGGGTGSCDEAAQRGLGGGLGAPAGTAYGYSNMNFCLLGLLIEDVTGEPYEAVVRSRLLEPLEIDGMRVAGTFDPDPAEVEHPSIPTRNYMETLGGAGAWVATAADVVRIVDSLDPATPGWKPLSEETAALMRLGAPGVTYAPDRWYGLGLIVSADGSWGHTGTVENTHAMVLRRPDGVTWCVLVNGEYPGNTSRLREIFDESLAEAGIRLT